MWVFCGNLANQMFRCFFILQKMRGKAFVNAFKPSLLSPDRWSRTIPPVLLEGTRFHFFFCGVGYKCCLSHQDVGHEWLLQIEALKAAGVNEVVLAINYQPEVKTEFTNQRMKSFFVQFYSVCPLQQWFFSDGVDLKYKIHAISWVVNCKL